MAKQSRKKASATYSAHPHVAEGLKWAESVVAGKTPANKFIVLACKRQLKDLTRVRWPFRFDADEAERVVAFIQMLPHTKGKWAAKRELLTLSAWQLFFVTTLFGWRNKKSGLRRFREGYLCVARKNGKSALAAAIGLYMLVADGEAGAEVYSGATTEKQAFEVFKPAHQMMRKSKELREYIGVEMFSKSLAVPADASKFEPLVGDPGDGQSPSCSIVDEYHEHRSANLFNTMESGMGARDQPLMLVITTSGSTIGGPCHTHQLELEALLQGVGYKSAVNEEKFVLLFGADQDDDWTSLDAIKKANPNMGISISQEYLIARQQDAMGSPSKQNPFKNKHLNMWTAARLAFYNILKWNKCRNPLLRVEDFQGKQCMQALDLASKSDLACYMKVFPVQKDKLHYYLFPKFYLPEDAVMEDSRGVYEKWVNAGLITVTEGNEIDFEVIEKDVNDDMALYDVIENAYDPWRAVELSRRMRDNGVPMVEYRNTTQAMSEPMKESEAAINGKRVHHDANDVMTWCIANVVARTDANSNVFPRKEGDQNKIDGAVAMIMAIGRLMNRDDISGGIDEWLSNPIAG